MTTLTRKQREIRDRERLILEVARQMFIERGYLGLSMDRIAEAIEYSKGTVYQHFRCKEDLLAALATITKLKRVELFEKAVQFNGRPREKMTAIGVADEIFASSYPDYIRTEELLNIDSIVSKASDAQQVGMRQVEERCVTAVCGTIQAGIDQGDLVLAANRTPQEIAFGTWGIAFGCRIVGKTPTCLHSLGISETVPSIRRIQQAYLDGWNWKPLSSEWDYDATRERIYQEIFPENRPS